MKKLMPVVVIIFFTFAIAFAIGGCDNPRDNADNASDNADNGGCDNPGNNGNDSSTPLSGRCLTQKEAAYEAAIRDRFQTGFNTWNSGYKAWLEWCDELYDENAHYNVYGHRMTLDEYKRMMGALFEQFEIMLGGRGSDAGDIQKVLVDPKEAMGSIQYAVSFKRKTEREWVTISTMEFVKWRPDEEFGARVVEGWALSDTEIEADMDVMAFYMNPANDWDTIMERVETWDK
jgi:hypothetical protein